MPRPQKITAAEFGARNPQAKGVFRTDKRGVRVFIAFEKKHRFPQGKGIRVTFGRGTTGGNLTDELRNIKRSQERAEKKVKIKKGIGLFDNPLSPQPQVVGVKRVVRKQQLAAQIRKFQQGKTKKLSKKALLKLERKERKKGGVGSIKAQVVVQQQGKSANEIVARALARK